MGYSTDLTDAEWAIIEPLLPKKRKTNKIKWDKRFIFNAILYQLKNVCNWRDLPMVSELVEEKTFPPFMPFIIITVYGVKMPHSTK